MKFKKIRFILFDFMIFKEIRNISKRSKSFLIKKSPIIGAMNMDGDSKNTSEISKTVSKSAEIIKDAVSKTGEKVKDSAIKSIEKKVESELTN